MVKRSPLKSPKPPQKKPAQKSTQKPDKPSTLKFVEELKRQWMATIDALNDPLMIIKSDYTIAKANLAMANLTDAPIRGLIGKKCYAVFAGRKSPCPNCKMSIAGETLTSQTTMLEGIRRGKYYEVTSHPIQNQKGDLEGVVQVYRDQTDARKLQDQLINTEKLASLGLLAGGIAHEINNPLGGILVFSQMLLREIPKESQHYADVVEIEAATQRCKSIVESLLEFARQRSATSKAETKEAVDIEETVKTALRFAKVGLKSAREVNIGEHWRSDLARPSADTPGLAPLPPLCVRGDRNRLVQVFLNLIHNAFQAMPDGGNLDIRSGVLNQGKDSSMVSIELRDTGVGIPKSQLKKIFDPFYTTKDPGEGTGLGLAICYGIVKEMGGTIEVESKINSGTNFRVLIPLISTADGDKITSKPIAPKKPLKTKKKS